MLCRLYIMCSPAGYLGNSLVAGQSLSLPSWPRLSFFVAVSNIKDNCVVPSDLLLQSLLNARAEPLESFVRIKYAHNGVLFL